MAHRTRARMETVGNVLGELMTDKKHGVVTTFGRAQPYAVWVDGETVLFTDSQDKADAKLWAEEKRMRAKR